MGITMTGTRDVLIIRSKGVNYILNNGRFIIPDLTSKDAV